jgi:glucose-6-phosphate 1-dehydrogenase
MQEGIFINPLQEAQSSKTQDPCIIVIFGATGDLTGRKLLPSLYNLARMGALPSHFACVGFARRPKSHEQFRQEMFEDCNTYSRLKPVDPELWKIFSEQLFYHQSEFENDEGYEKLREFLSELDARFGTRQNRIFYLSVPPSHFPLIAQKLGQHGLIADPEKVQDHWTRVIVEKPFGRDLASAKKLQEDLTAYFRESQIYRIDHYLGKETVQNLMVLRFANPIFEQLWNNKYIDHIQISVAEEIGVGTRGKFWEEAGMLRDMVQNHLMQLLSLVAMEPPTSLHPDSIRDEKVKVLESIRPIPSSEMDKYAIRGQYGAGFINGEAAKAYTKEDNVHENSPCETFAALEFFIDNWRWAGVPFYLRAGKRLPKRATQIAVIFKEAPGVLFNKPMRQADPNVLVIRIQPDEGISLRMNTKIPGINSPIQPVKMDFQYRSYFGGVPPDAYERLLCDCIIGDPTLFAREDEVMASWKLFTPILEHWKEVSPHDFPNYACGTWGPHEADQMMSRYGRRWCFL